jgi:polyisoprenoid-binding protein YceI
MKTLLFVPFLTAAWAVAPANALPGDPVWVVDNGHSSVVFKIQHVGATNFYGAFRKISGGFTLDKAKPDASSIEVTIDAASIDTRDEARDKHLRGTDFFDVKQFAEISFKSTKVTPITGDKRGEVFEVVGDLEMRGKKQVITVQVVKTGEAEMMGKRIGYETTFIIKRSDFGLDYGVANKALGDEVTLTVAIEGVEPKKK